MAVNAHATLAQAHVSEVLLPAKDPAPFVQFVGLAPRVIPHEVHVGAFADFGLHVAQAQSQGVDPHFAFKRQFAPPTRHKRQVEARPVPVIERVEDVVAVVHVSAVVEGAGERAVEQQHLVLVQVDVQKLALHARRVFPVFHPRGTRGLDPFFAPPTFGAQCPRHFRHEEGKGHAVLGGVEVLPNPRKRSPPPPLGPALGVVVDGHLLHVVECVIQRGQARRVVLRFRFGHTLHEWFGGIHRFFVRPYNRGLEVHTTRLKGHVDDLRYAALQRDGLALEPQTRNDHTRHALVACIESVHAFDVGHGAQVGPCEAHIHEGKGFAAFAVKDASGDGGLGGGEDRAASEKKSEKDAHQRPRRLS